MGRILQSLVYICCILIVFNAVTVIFKVMVSLHSSTHHLLAATNLYCDCKCGLPASRYTEHHAAQSNRSELLPKSLLSRKRLSRIGSDMNFLYNTCPPGSLMLNAAKLLNSKPLHEDCPLLFIIGAHRAGTSSLYQYLSRHSDFRGIRLDKGPFAGDTYHFSTGRYRRESWERYKSFSPTSVLSGEKSVNMFITCEAPRWLFESCGRSTKVIILLRNPVKRYISAMEKKTAQEILAQVFTDRQLYSEQRTKMSNPSTCLNLYNQLNTNNLYHGMYSTHLINWLCNFPSENILVVNSEEFNRSTSDVLRQVLEFIHLVPFTEHKLSIVVNVTYNNQQKRYNGGPEDNLMRDAVNNLVDFYGSYNRELFDLLYWNSSLVDWPL